jgi:hypothetical protein
MSSRTPQDNNGNQDDQDSEGTQRPSRQIRLWTASMDPQSDDEDSYEPSNDDNHEDNLDDNHENTAAVGDATEIINPLDYIAADHPLRPARKSLILDNPRMLNRFRNHPEFWWEVLLAMQKRAKTNQSRNTDQMLRDEILQLADQVQDLRRERTTALAQKDDAEAKTVHLNREMEKLKRERDQDQAMIVHLSSRHRTVEVRIPERVDDSPLHETIETPRVNTTRRTTTRHPSTLPEEPHNNPKFPVAPISPEIGPHSTVGNIKCMTSYTTVSLSTRQTTIRSLTSKAEQKEEHTNRFEHRYRELAREWRVKTDWEMKEPKEPKPAPGQNGICVEQRAGV